MSTSSSPPHRNLESLMLQNLEPILRQHLFKVYTCMALTCASAAVGSTLHLTGLWTAGFLTVFLQFALLIVFVLTPKQRDNRRLRTGLLLAVGALTGHLLGLLIEQVMVVNPAFVMTALLGTTITFTWLSFASLLARRGSHLVLGGVLSTITCALVIVGIGNLFYESWIVHKLSLYVALAVMCGFVLFDTQMVMEDFRSGDDDYLSHSLRLFFNVVDIFRLLMAIFVTKEEDNQRRRNNRDQDDD